MLLLLSRLGGKNNNNTAATHIQLRTSKLPNQYSSANLISHVAPDFRMETPASIGSTNVNPSMQHSLPFTSDPISNPVFTEAFHASPPGISSAAAPPVRKTQDIFPSGCHGKSLTVNRSMRTPVKFNTQLHRRRGTMTTQRRVFQSRSRARPSSWIFGDCMKT